MVDFTPLTGAPVPELDDNADIEAAVPPSVEALERFVIPRFSSENERTNAFAEATNPPAVGQVVYVGSINQFVVWDGSAWVLLSAFIGQNEQHATPNGTFETESGIFQDIEGLSLPVQASSEYKVELTAIYGGDATVAAINFNHSGSLSIGAIAMGPESDGPSRAAQEMWVDNLGGRTSGDSEFFFRTRGENNGLYAHFNGLLRTGSSGAGTLQVTLRRHDTATGGDMVFIAGASLLTVKRIGAN